MTTGYDDPASTYCKLHDLPCARPDRLMAGCEEQGIPTDLFDGKANSYTNVLGPSPGVGWVLLPRELVDSLDIEDEHVLEFLGDAYDGQPVKCRRLHIVEARAALRIGIEDDPGAMYLVKLADRRDWAATRMWAESINKQYNVRNPIQIGEDADPDDRYYIATRNPDTDEPWTWDEMVGDIWGEIELLGDFPGLPDNVEPDGTPENFVFNGNAYDALTAVLERIGCALRHDPYTEDDDSAFDLVELGTADDESDDLFEAARERLRTPDEPIEPHGRRTPSSVAVTFRAVQSRGTESLLDDDEGHWINLAVHTVVKTAAECGYTDVLPIDAQAQLNDDLGADLNYAGEVTNESDLDDRALDRATRLYAMATSERWERFHRGMVPIPTDGVCRSVCLRQDQDGAWTHSTAGPYLPRVMDSGLDRGGDGVQEGPRTLAAPDTGGFDFPLFPGTDWHVVISDGEGDDSDYPEPSSDGYYRGYASLYDPDNDVWGTSIECFWLPPDDDDSAGTLAKAGKRYGSRLNGIVTDSDSGDTLPLFIGYAPLTIEIVGGTIAGNAGYPGNSNRWYYEVDADDGRTLSDVLNGREDPNVDGDGDQGNGDTTGDDGTATLTLKAIVTGTWHMFMCQRIDGDIRWKFSAQNGDQVVCD